MITFEYVEFYAISLADLKLPTCSIGVSSSYTLAIEPVLGKWGSWFIQSKGVPGYPEVVVVNTGGGVLTKVGSVRGGSGH